MMSLSVRVAYLNSVSQTFFAVRVSALFKTETKHYIHFKLLHDSYKSQILETHDADAPTITVLTTD